MLVVNTISDGSLSNSNSWKISLAQKFKDTGVSLDNLFILRFTDKNVFIYNLIDIKMSAKNIRELVEQAQLQEYKKELYYIWSDALN